MATSKRTFRKEQRSAQQAIQKDQLGLAQDQGALRSRTRQFRKEINSYRGATRMATQATQAQGNTKVAQSLAGTPEGRQLAQEIRGRTKDLHNSLPFTIAATQRDFKGDRADLMQTIANDRLALSQDQQNFQSSIADQLAQQQQNQQQKAADVQTAVREALRLIHEQADINASSDPKLASHKTPSAIPQTDLQWQSFFEHLRSQEGVDARSARKAIKHIQRAQARETQQAATPQSPHKYQSRPPLYQGF